MGVLWVWGLTYFLQTMAEWREDCCLFSSLFFSCSPDAGDFICWQTTPMKTNIEKKIKFFIIARFLNPIRSTRFPNTVINYITQDNVINLIFKAYSRPHISYPIHPLLFSYIKVFWRLMSFYPATKNILDLHLYEWNISSDNPKILKIRQEIHDFGDGQLFHIAGVRTAGPQRSRKTA